MIPRNTFYTVFCVKNIKGANLNKFMIIILLCFAQLVVISLRLPSKFIKYIFTQICIKIFFNLDGGREDRILALHIHTFFSDA